MAESTNPTAAVLLDLDGTLIDTQRLYLECYRQAVRPHVGRDLSMEEILALRPRSELRFLRDVVGPERLKACLEDFHRAYDRLHDAHFRGIFPGVPEMLERLRTAGLTLGIVTGKTRRSWELTRCRTELGAFDVLVFDEDVNEPKPDPEGLRLALERLVVEPDQALYLGDSHSDIEAASAAGVRPAAALWARKPEDHDAFLARIEPLGVPAFTTPADFGRWVLASVAAPAAPPPANHRLA